MISRRFCDERQRLIAAFTHAVSEFLRMESAQMAAVIEGSSDTFDAEVDAARQRKEAAGRGVVEHQRNHGC